MKTTKFVFLSGVLSLGAVAACGSTTEHGSPATPAFVTELAGDQLVGGLSEAEASALCEDTESFLNSDSLRQDECHLVSIFLAAIMSGFEPDATTAELRGACTDSYNECMQGAVLEESLDSCSTSTMGECSASVEEYSACLEDSVAQLHELAQTLPACGEFSPDQSGVLEPEPGLTSMPASCQTFLLKCPSIPRPAMDFVNDYCAQVEPCCNAAGALDSCRVRSIQLLQDVEFDQTVADTCLTQLAELRQESGYCDGFTSKGNIAAPARATACSALFEAWGEAVPMGSTPAGGECSFSEDCAPSEGVAMHCVSNWEDNGVRRFCAAMHEGAPGEACVGSSHRENGREIQWQSDVTKSGGALCERGHGLYCDDATQLCTELKDLGEDCTSTLQCAHGAFCQGVCTEQRAPGMACSAWDGECAAGASCEDNVCSAHWPAATECTDDTAHRCGSGWCEDGRCSDPLALFCRL